MQSTLLKAREEQAVYEERRREMIAGICHDISTPLTSVKGYASGILEGVANTCLLYTSCTLDVVIR